MDKLGNISMCYSVSSQHRYPSLECAFRKHSDPPNKMTNIFELVDGLGSEIETTFWGYYTTISVDPDECTFWFTGKYLSKNSGPPLPPGVT